MSIALLDSDARTLADIVRGLDVSFDRIRLPVGEATEDDVVRLLDRDDKHLCELIDGVLVEKVMGYREAMIAGLVVHYLNEFVQQRDLGIVLTPDGPIRIRPGRIRIPDVSFLSWSQFPDRELPDDAICDAVPELAVEVISDSNTRKEMESKLRDYFGAGVALVWFLYPKTNTAVVYTSPARKKAIAPEGALDGGKVLPGFSLSLSKLFAALKRRKKP